MESRKISIKHVIWFHCDNCGFEYNLGYKYISYLMKNNRDMYKQMIKCPCGEKMKKGRKNDSK